MGATPQPNRTVVIDDNQHSRSRNSGISNRSEINQPSGESIDTVGVTGSIPVSPTTYRPRFPGPVAVSGAGSRSPGEASGLIGATREFRRSASRLPRRRRDRRQTGRRRCTSASQRSHARPDDQARDHAHAQAHGRDATSTRWRRHRGHRALARPRTPRHRQNTPDMNQKEAAIAQISPPETRPGRYRPPDPLLAFLD